MFFLELNSSFQIDKKQSKYQKKLQNYLVVQQAWVFPEVSKAIYL